MVEAHGWCDLWQGDAPWRRRGSSRKKSDKSSRTATINDEWLTAAEAAEYLKLSECTVRDWGTDPNDDFPPGCKLKPDRRARRLWNRRELDEWVASRPRHIPQGHGRLKSEPAPEAA